VLNLTGFPSGLSVREIVKLGNVESADDEAILNELDKVGLKVKNLDAKLGDPDAFEKVRVSLQQPAHEFIQPSGGQVKRLALARMRRRLENARLLILDEPDAHLDDDKFELVFSILDDRKNCTVVWITHDISMIARAEERVNSVYVMKGGKMLEHGTPEDLRNRGGEYHRLLQGQRKM
jgi:ABC-type multidrug transport system fused ATPase/permease subunit